MVSEKVNGESSLCRDFESLSVSKRLVRSFSQKFKRKNLCSEAEEDDDSRRVSMRCLTLYGRGGGCKVGAATSEEFGDLGCRRRSSAGEEGKLYKTICGTEEPTVDCFSYGVREMFWRKSSREMLELEQETCGMDVFLPDDILEMCLVRLPLTSLMTARLVCRKWRALTTTHRFMQMRQEGFHQTPWLFLFGVVKDGGCSREVHALDVSLNKWHEIDAEVLKERFSFSVVGVHDDVYIVGGCSGSTTFVSRTHKGVWVFSTLTKSWHKAASMKHARSSPILGVYEVKSDFSIVRNHNLPQERRPRTRVGGVSDVYEDPHRLSVRRQLRNSLDGSEVSLISSMKPYKFVRQRGEQSNTKDCKRFLIIAVGGHGAMGEPLYSCEIYDSLSNKWMEIQSLPFGFGSVRSAVVCNGKFYVYSETDKLLAYDIERGFWFGVQTTTHATRVQEFHPKLISCNERLFMLSVSWCEGDGQIGRRNKAVRKLWELDLISLNWIEVSSHPDAPMDWNAAFVGDKDLIFGLEMFKIFAQVLYFLTVYDLSDTSKTWSHISRSHVVPGLDATSCSTKSMAVLHL